MASQPTTPTASRPGSRAQSDVSFATEVQESQQLPRPRSLAQEVDHIKSLIARSQGVPRPAEGTITAQIFRRRSNSTEPVPHSRIVHELDSLKRRIRQEQQLIRRPSEIDPETESEADDVVDEGDEELENTRKALEKEREQREEWIASAESRVDVLDSSLESTRKENEDLRASRDDALASLETVQSQKEEVSRTLEDVRRALQDLQRQMEDLSGEKQKSDSATSEANEQLSKLQQLKAEVDKSLASSNEKVAELEENNQTASRNVQELTEQHKSQVEQSETNLKELQDRYNDIEKEAEFSLARAKELESKDADHEVQRDELNKQLEEHKTLLQNTRRDVDLHGKEFAQLLEKHHIATSEIETLTKERDDQKASFEEMLATKEDEAKNSKEGHDYQLRSLADDHEVQRKKLGDRLDEVKALHSDELNGLRSAHEKAIQDLNTSATDAQREARESHQRSEARIADLEDRLVGLQEENQKLQAEVQKKEASYNEQVKAAEANTEHMGNRIASAEQRANEAEASSKTKEEQLKRELSEKNSELANVHGQLSELHQKLHESSSELSRVSHELSVAADERRSLDENGKAQESALLDLKSKHVSELDELKVNHVAEIDRRKKEAEDDAEKARQNNVDDLEKVHADHRSVLEEVERQAESRLNIMKDDHKRDLENLTMEHRSALEKADDMSASRHNEAMKQMQAEEVDLRKQTKDVHDDEMNHLRSQMDTAQNTHKTSIAELSDKLHVADRRLKEQQADHAAEIVALKAEYEQSASTSSTQHGEAISALRTDLSKAKEAMDAAKKSSVDEITRLRGEHEQQVRNLESGWSSKAEEAARYQADMQRAANEASEQSTRERNDLQSQISEHTANAAAELANLRQKHADELAGIKEDLQSQLDAAQTAVKDGERALEASKEQHKAMVEELQSVQGKDVSRIRELEESETEHRTAFSKLEETIKALQGEKTKASTEHSSVLEKLEQVQSSLSTSKIEMQQQHENALREALDKAHKDNEERVKARMQVNFAKAYEDNKHIFEERMVDVEKKANERAFTLESQIRNDKAQSEAQLVSARKVHGDELSRVRNEMEEKMRNRVSDLEGEHKRAMTAALDSADDKLEERLKVQSKAYDKQLDDLQASLHAELESLQLQLEQANELRHAQMQEAEVASRKTLTELGEKLDAAEQTSVALQARLDNALGERGKVELSLAEVRRQRFEDEKRTTESKVVLQRQIEDLQAERDALASKNEQLRASQVDDESAVVEHADQQDSTRDVTVLKKRLSMAEKGREDAHLSVQQEMDRKSELARQNEFLAKELETLMATRSAPLTLVANHADASAQTDTVVVMSEADYFDTVREHKSDVAIATVAKRQQPVQRSSTAVKQKQIETNGAEDRAWKTRSFEDYLKQAQAELSELGSVISANEALFAQKIQEHVGDLQRAKDQLASEYKDKFDALLADKDRMEREVSAKNAAEFAEERKQLVASYGADHEEPARQATAVTNLSSTKRKALQSAEERLVSEYNRRIVKRKSQIALKHAEDYQSLAQDYDRRIAELLGNRNKLESDLSVEPSKFEKDLDQFQVMSAQLETEKASSAQNSPQSSKFNGAYLDDSKSGDSPRDSVRKSQLPKRSLTSTPRTPTTIPRAVPYPGNREGMSASNSQHKPQNSVDTRRSVSERYPPVRQQSLLSPKSPVGMHNSKSTANHPRTAEPLRSKFSIDPPEVEQQTAPPDITKVPQQPMRYQKDPRRSIRHSSRIIFGDWQGANG